MDDATWCHVVRIALVLFQAALLNVGLEPAFLCVFPTLALVNFSKM